VHGAFKLTQFLKKDTDKLINPSRSSLRDSSNGDLFQPRIGDLAFSVAAPRAWNCLPTELKLTRSSTATFGRHLKSFRSVYYVMHFVLRADCRRRCTNSAVTVTLCFVWRVWECV